MKKIKAFLLTTWFILSIIFICFSGFVNSEELVTLGILNITVSFALIISDEELRGMNLF